jgi:hypothetical protein
MNKYQVVIPYTGIDHWQAQTYQMKKFNEAGIAYQNYKWTMGSHKNGFDLHDWEIKCTEEQLSFLVLSCGAYLRQNLNVLI